jgi:hypothetical protein
MRHPRQPASGSSPRKTLRPSRVVLARVTLGACALAGLLATRPAAAQPASLPLTGSAWSENVGWIDFAPAHGGARIAATHLSGYAWGPDVGWIKLGADAGGPYANSGPADWGVNRDAAGALSGYAWSETLGWIHFGAGHAQLGIGPGGALAGYAWSDTLGWIHFDGPGYQVTGGGSGGAAEIPTVGEWGLLLLAVVLAALGATRLARVPGC